MKPRKMDEKLKKKSSISSFGLEKKDTKKTLSETGLTPSKDLQDLAQTSPIQKTSKP